ncbi:hypothetical protein D8674_035582 [Pyrus ussuriensis x Pyrus communis]|uniref:Peptidase A1 domain-containing protein n=1 Tax=Pyrus ussuriensis x Pyrus communis TaxID=2448454 RepID=A0A5N5GCT6_9ROSA|nr:hypothetical protein D8674_035582 [Pyrus ussuriensis x Pyrus communis]
MIPHGFTFGVHNLLVAPALHCLQAVVLTLRPAVSPIYPVDLHQVNIAIPKSVTTGIGAGRQIYEVPSFISMANAFPPVSLNFPGGVSMLLKPQEYLLNTSFFFKFYLPTPANGVTTWEIAFQKSQGPVTIFGDIILKDKIIEYDLARQRLGWPTRDCSLPMDGCERKFWQK